MTKKILGWGIVNALATWAYIGLVVTLLNNAEKFIGDAGKIVAPMIFLLMFVVSASVTAALVLGRPIWWYLEGQKTEAVKLFATTISWLVLFLVVVILGQIGYSKWLAHPKNLAGERAAVSGLANPASVNCADKGGRSMVQKNSNGGEYGLCYFDDNRACEEWAMMRGTCPVGGVKTTGYDTDAQKYCAWVGGRTVAMANAVCTFADGSSCLADDLYGGKCQPGEKK